MHWNHTNDQVHLLMLPRLLLMEFLDRPIQEDQRLSRNVSRQRQDGVEGMSASGCVPYRVYAGLPNDQACCAVNSKAAQGSGTPPQLV